MRIAIVDDKQEDRKHLYAMLEQYCAARAVTAEIACFSSGDAMDAACLDAMRNDRSLTAHVGGTELNLRYEDIFYIDCTNRQARLHLRESIIKIDEPVNILIGLLAEDERFLMCNRNTLVNMDHIELVEDHDFRMQNGTCVPLRQRGRAALKKTFLTWSLRELRKEERI